MLRIICPKCKNKVTLGDESRGQAAACPECAARFRVPVAKPASAIVLARTVNTPRAAPPPRSGDQGPAPRPRRMEDREDEGRPRRKKRGRRQRSLTNQLADMNFLIVLGVIGAIAVFSIGLAVISPRLAVLSSVLGFIIALGGNIWFLLYAFKESVLWGLGCLFVPMVGLVFLAMHFEETWRPFVIGMIGGAMVMAGTLFGPVGVTSPLPHMPAMPRGR